MLSHPTAVWKREILCVFVKVCKFRFKTLKIYELNIWEKEWESVRKREREEKWNNEYANRIYIYIYIVRERERKKYIEREGWVRA